MVGATVEAGILGLGCDVDVALLAAVGGGPLA